MGTFQSFAIDAKRWVSIGLYKLHLHHKDLSIALRTAEESGIKLPITSKVKELEVDYPSAKVIGHNEISEKECPSFDVQKWKADNLWI